MKKPEVEVVLFEKELMTTGNSSGACEWQCWEVTYSCEFECVKFCEPECSANDMF